MNGKFIFSVVYVYLMKKNVTGSTKEEQILKTKKIEKGDPFTQTTTPLHKQQQEFFL